MPVDKPVEVQEIGQKLVYVPLLESFPLGDGIGRIRLIDCMGSDLSVVNDAKSSFDNWDDELTEKGVRLINFLSSHKPPHTSPFRGVVLKFKVKAHLSLARQWYKHTIASNHVDDQYQWNEKSFRYTEAIDPDEFYIPAQFYGQSESNRQASGEPLGNLANQQAIAIARNAVRGSYAAYRSLIETGVSREMARNYLDPAIYTTWTWTVSLQAALHFVALRFIGEGAQHEIALYAEAVYKMISRIAPETVNAFEKHHPSM
jgi:thymidylate synthase (FAD)